MNKKQNKPVLAKISSFRKKQYLQIAKKLGFEDLLPKLEKSEKYMQLMDLKYTRLEIVPRDFEIPPHTMRDIESRCMDNFQQRTFTFTDFPGEFSVYECVILFQKFQYALHYGFTPESKVALRTADWVEKYLSHRVTMKIAAELGFAVLQVIYQYSSLEHYVYGFRPENAPVRRDDQCGATARFAIIREKPVVKKIRVGKEIRSGFSLLTNSLMDRFKIETVHWKGTIYDLYIQGHALKRMEERIDVSKYVVQDLLTFDTEYSMVREYRGRLLIPVFEPNRADTYREAHLGNRIGYLIGTICEDVVLIRTFLFLAQDFTPEGDKLSQLLELKMIDKSYLKLDRLEHFTRSDLRKDETLRPIFKAARLDHLFDVEDAGVLPELTGSAEFIREMLELN